MSQGCEKCGKKDCVCGGCEFCLECCKCPERQPDGRWEPKKKSNDSVDHPSHYQNEQGKECIDILHDMLSKDAFEGYLMGNVLKYIYRYKGKNGAEDLKKAQWYLERLMIIVNNA